MLGLFQSAKEVESRYNMDPSQVKGYNLSPLCKFFGLRLSLVIGDKNNTHTSLWISTANNTAAAATSRQINEPWNFCHKLQKHSQRRMGGERRKIGVGKAVLSSTGTCGRTWIYRLAGPTVETVRTFVMKEKRVTCLSKHPSYAYTVLYMTCN